MGRLLLFYVVPLVLAIYCLVNAITSRDSDIRNLPKVAWILLILFFPVIGSIAWLVAGRPVEARTPRHERAVPQFPEYDRPGRMAAVDPETDAEFLRKIRERAEERRKAPEEKKRQAKESEPEAEPDETV